MFTTRIIAAIGLAVPAVAMAQTPTAPTYVAKAGAGDMYEKTSSKLVLGTTQDPKIRDFATMMVTDHTKSTNDVKTAARADRVPVRAPKLNAEQSRMVAALRKTTGPARDQLYVQQQKTAHEQALALHSGYAASGDKPDLKRVAGATAPVVQHHIDMLAGM